ncbi:MAG: hypothetical protein ASARMPREDX12_000533 [Alectoria sarmentosa]|nr:MAG: hypothetical protein ASARMPREDX12_000533 [Alectoria sarmentosa]CAD6574936.1 MAG: hypothetical protein ASARMPRED_006998 [Alectoria sarmentosa]
MLLSFKYAQDLNTFRIPTVFVLRIGIKNFQQKGAHPTATNRTPTICEIQSEKIKVADVHTSICLRRPNVVDKACLLLFMQKIQSLGVGTILYNVPHIECNIKSLHLREWPRNTPPAALVDGAQRYTERVLGGVDYVRGLLLHLAADAREQSWVARVSKAQLIDNSVKSRLIPFRSLVVPMTESLLDRSILSQGHGPTDQEQLKDVVSNFIWETKVAEWAFALERGGA